MYTNMYIITLHNKKTNTNINSLNFRFVNVNCYRNIYDKLYLPSVRDHGKLAAIEKFIFLKGPCTCKYYSYGRVPPGSQNMKTKNTSFNKF